MKRTTHLITIVAAKTCNVEEYVYTIKYFLNGIQEEDDPALHGDNSHCRHARDEQLK